MVSLVLKRSPFAGEGFALALAGAVSPVCIKFAVFFKHGLFCFPSVDVSGYADGACDTAGHRVIFDTAIQGAGFRLRRTLT